MSKDAVSQHLKTAYNLTWFMDDQFKIGFWRFGFDSIADIVPLLGTVVPSCAHIYLIWFGYQMGMRDWQLLQLVVIALFDLGIGIPSIFGSIFDAWFKGMNRSYTILEQYAVTTYGVPPRPLRLKRSR